MNEQKTPYDFPTVTKDLLEKWALVLAEDGRPMAYLVGTHVPHSIPLADLFKPKTDLQVTEPVPVKFELKRSLLIEPLTLAAIKEADRFIPRDPAAEVIESLRVACVEMQRLNARAKNAEREEERLRDEVRKQAEEAAQLLRIYGWREGESLQMFLHRTTNELAEARKALADVWGWVPPHSGMLEKHNAVFDIARAAIAKAKGGAL